MKKMLISLVIGLLIGALGVFFIFQETTPQKIESAEENSFYEVTSKLNLGGNLYLYLSSEQTLSPSNAPHTDKDLPIFIRHSFSFIIN